MGGVLAAIMRGRVFSGSASFRTGPGRFASMRRSAAKRPKTGDDDGRTKAPKKAVYIANYERLRG